MLVLRLVCCSLTGDELLSAIDVVGRAREAVLVMMCTASAATSAGPTTPDGKRGAELIATVFELIAEQRGRQRCADEAGGDQIDSDRCEFPRGMLQALGIPAGQDQVGPLSARSPRRFEPTAGGTADHDDGLPEQVRFAPGGRGGGCGAHALSAGNDVGAHRRPPSIWSAPSLAASSEVFPCARPTMLSPEVESRSGFTNQ